MIQEDDPVRIPVSEVDRFLHVENRRIEKEQVLLLEVLELAEEMVSTASRARSQQVEVDETLAQLKEELNRRDETIAQLIEEKVSLELEMSRISSGGLATLGFKKWWSKR